MIRTSVSWRYEVQQIDVLSDGGLSTAEVYLSLDGPENDTAVGTYLNDTYSPITGASLLDSATSAADLAAALESLPSAGKVTVVRVPTASIGDSSIASRHLVTFFSRGGDVPLLAVEDSIVNGTEKNDTDATR